ncbi:MAG: endolytic transglycosylase MltG [Patescibacteria group bacterium]|jgi:UPF0755 protein
MPENTKNKTLFNIKNGIFLGLIILFLVFVILMIVLFLPRDRKAKARDFTIKSGETTREIAASLKTGSFIRSSTLFLVEVKIRGGFIQAGVYKISPAESLGQICLDLINKKSSEDEVTIPEGWRVTQIDALLAAKGIITAGSLTRIASGDEGYLFPDTYFFLPKTDPLEIRQTMLDNFDKKTSGLNINTQTIILASIVERESKFDEDRPQIARVFLNRLAINMKLQADPTVQYAKGSWDPITTADYQNVNSSYNTYLYTGLPPGPICNPGLKSIEAAIHPAKSDYLYFFDTKDGHAVFAQTLQEQIDNLKNNQS